MMEEELDYEDYESTVAGGTIVFGYREPNCLQITLNVDNEEDIDALLKLLKENVDKYRDRIIPTF